MLTVTRYVGQATRIELPDGRFGWIIINHHEHRNNNKVKLSLDFPKDILIQRDEILPEEEQYANRQKTAEKPAETNLEAFDQDFAKPGPYEDIGVDQ